MGRGGEGALDMGSAPPLETSSGSVSGYLTVAYRVPVVGAAITIIC